MQPNNPQIQPQPQPAPYYDDEISLLDLWRTLVRRKVVVLAAALIVMLGAGGYLLVATPLYESKVIIQVGRTTSGEDVPIPIEDPNILQQRLTAELHSISSVSVSKQGIVTIVMRAESPAEGERRLRAIIDKILAEHQAVYDKATGFLIQRQQLLRQQINKLSKQQREMGQLIEQLKIKENFQAAFFVLENGNIAGRLLELEQKLLELELNDVGFDRTRLFGEISTTNRPVKPKIRLVLALGAVLGLMLGVFAAFFAEFLAKAREDGGRAK